MIDFIIFFIMTSFRKKKMSDSDVRLSIKWDLGRVYETVKGKVMCDWVCNICHKPFNYVCEHIAGPYCDCNQKTTTTSDGSWIDPRIMQPPKKEEKRNG